MIQPRELGAALLPVLATPRGTCKQAFCRLSRYDSTGFGLCACYGSTRAHGMEYRRSYHDAGPYSGPREYDDSRGGGALQGL